MRTVLSLVFLTAILWASCTVKLGAYTLSEHVDRIGETEPAKELLEGTRGRISPVLEDMKQRIFGEYVEAPTGPGKDPAVPRRRPARPSQPEVPARVATPRDAGAIDRSRPDSSQDSSRGASSSREPSSAEAARLPGVGRRAVVRREGS